jgi:hypothetical protein
MNNELLPLSIQIYNNHPFITASCSFQHSAPISTETPHPYHSVDSTVNTNMIEAASTSETSVNFYQTARRYNPEDSHLHIRRRDNLNSY